MHIGLVLSKTPGYSETFFRSKIKELQQKGHTVTLFVQQSDKDFSACEVCVGFIGKSKMRRLATSIKAILGLLPRVKTVVRYITLERQEGVKGTTLLKKLILNSHLLQAKVDWLHFGFATQAIGSELVAKAIGAKMAVSFRGFDIAIYPLKHPNCYKDLWKYVDRVHTISGDLHKKALELGLSKEIPVVKIPPAIDVSYFKPTASKPMYAPCQIVTIARLHWKKGLIPTLQALAYLKGEGVAFSYFIIGTGDKKETERLQFEILELGLREEVTLVGKKSRKAVREYLEKADIYLQYSISEGFCNAVLEAQAMGKLCVVSDAEGLTENVLDKTTGWVVPKLQPEKLARKLQYVLQLSKTEKEQIVSKAIARVREEFNLEKQQEKFVTFYTKPL